MAVSLSESSVLDDVVEFVKLVEEDLGESVDDA
jgi:hypothetical protein